MHIRMNAFLTIALSDVRYAQRRLLATTVYLVLCPGAYGKGGECSGALTRFELVQRARFVVRWGYCILELYA